MRNLIALLAVLLVGACATMPRSAAPNHPGFRAQEVLRIEFQYSDPSTPIAFSAYGPTDKEFLCKRDAAAQAYPTDTEYNNTCLVVMFDGPLPKGATVTQPSALPMNHPVAVALVAVEFGADGRYINAQTLHFAPNLATAKFQADDLRTGWYKDGSIPKGNSLLIYLVGVIRWSPPPPPVPKGGFAT